MDGITINEEKLLMKKLTNARSETKYAAVYVCLHKGRISLSSLLQIATDRASAMTGKHNGFIVKLKEAAGHIGYWQSTALFIDNTLQLKL